MPRGRRDEDEEFDEEEEEEEEDRPRNKRHRSDFIDDDDEEDEEGEDGGEGEGNWFVPDILVKVCRLDEDSHVAVIKEVLADGSCKVALGISGAGETLTAFPADLGTVKSKKSYKIKIMSGSLRGLTGKLIGVDGSDGMVKVG